MTAIPVKTDLNENLDKEQAVELFNLVKSNRNLLSDAWPVLPTEEVYVFDLSVSTWR